MDSDLIEKLSGGDRRSIGRSEEVVADILAQPDRFGELFECILTPDPLVRMRAADAAEKLTAKRPDLLQPHKDSLLHQVAQIPQQEVRWHVAQMLPRLQLSMQERQEAVSVLERYLEDHSKIVVTFSMQALADLALQDASLRPQVRARIEQLSASGSPAIRSRGRKLLHQLKQA
jgi:hypothetical protein